MRIPFSFRLISSVVIIEIIMLGILVWNNVSLINQSYSELLGSSARDQSALLASAIAPGLVAHDYALIDDALSLLKERHDLLYAEVFDISGKRIAAIGQFPEAEKYSSPEKYQEIVEKNKLQISRVVEVSGQEAGVLRVGYSTVNLRNIIDDVRWQNLVISFVTLLVLILATVIISYFVTGKLRKLKHGVEQIQDGNLNHEINIKKNDELGDLAKAFNDMARHLASIQHQLFKEHSELERKSSHLSTLLNSIDAVVWEANARTKNLIFVSTEAVDMLGYSVDKWFEPEFFENVVFSEDKKILTREMNRMASGIHQASIDVRFKNIDKSLVWTRIIAGSEYDENSDKLVIRGLMIDITDEKKREQQMIYLAEHDPLTGLINRRQFQDRLTHHVAYGKRYGHNSCLLFIDLDQFKYINDTFGHAAGDTYLIQVAEVLAHAVRDTDILGRLGGDEFGVVLPFTDEEEACLVAANLLTALAEKNWTYNGENVLIRASIGITNFPSEDKTPSELLAEADTAMYAAKSLGRNRYHVYREHDSGKERMQEKLQSESLIRLAFKNNYFVLDYQPIVCLVTGKVQHHEALLRIKKQDGEIIGPGEFIDTAERFGLIGDIDRWTFTQVIQIIHQSLQDKRIKDIAVNLSGNNLDDMKFHTWIEEMLNNFSGVSNHLIIEITETAAIKNIISARGFIDSMLAMGVRFAIDDFGVGFSSFHYIKTLPVAYIKIDGSFVRQLHADTVDRVFVQATVDIAKSLGISTIAEFVENEEIVSILKDVGADFGQGYYLGKPDPEFVD
ncbi:MAG: EAL domain-containing protein [Gammaproteobacteria bacterium]|nr:EAL domain-containing protein [Gammaproteobacteria bacterium]